MYQCSPVEAVIHINSEQLPEPDKMPAKDQQEFNENVEKWVSEIRTLFHNCRKAVVKIIKQIKKTILPEKIFVSYW